MGVNGYSLTFEQMVLRRIEAKYLFSDVDASESKARKYLDKMKHSEVLSLYSEVFEEVFK